MMARRIPHLCLLLVAAVLGLATTVAADEFEILWRFDTGG